MLITSISIRNFMGVEEAKYDIGRITDISGKNGRGKTTLVSALQNALGGGDLAKLQNVHVEGEAELGLVIDNGAFVVKRKGKDTTVEQRVGNSAAYEKVRKPQTFIDSLYDAMLSDPMRLYRASAKDQFDILLEILAGDLTPDQIKAAVGEDLWPSISAPVLAGGHPLQILTNVSTALYDERTGVNRTKGDKERTVQTIRKEIPADMPEASAEAIGAIEKERDELAARVREGKANAEHAATEIVTKASAAYETKKAAVEGDFKSKAANIRRTADQALATAKTDGEREVAEIRAEAERRVAARMAVYQDLADNLKARADKEVEEIRASGEAVIEEAYAVMDEAQQRAASERSTLLAQIAGTELELGAVIGRLERARKDAEQYTRLVALKGEADRHEADAVSLKGRSERLTEGLDAVETLKGSLLADLPIDGLEIDGRTIRLNKVPLEQQNTETRLRFAAAVAALRARRHPLKLVFVDNAESLDTEHRVLLLAELEARGVQVIVARVTDGALNVDAREHAAVSA